MAASATQSSSLSLKEYLKRYETDADDSKKKRKKKQKKKSDPTGVCVVDEDPVWQKPVQLEEEDKDSSDEAAPQIDEDIEVKRMKRLEQIRQQKPYLAISDDGSGWISVSDTGKPKSMERGDLELSPPRRQGPSSLGDEISGLSPPRRRCRRVDTPSPKPEHKQPSMDQIRSSSPSRRSTFHQETASVSPDLSPPRRGRRLVDTPYHKHASELPEPHMSPPRRQGSLSHSAFGSPDLSPPRQRKKRVDTPSPEPKSLQPKSVSRDQDLSPPRRSHPHMRSPDVSPHHRSLKHLTEAENIPSSLADLSPPRKARKDNNSGKEGRRAGLFTAHEIKEEIDKTKQEETLRYTKLDPSISGKGAEPVYRHQGKRISKEEYLKLKGVEEKPKDKKLEWGKGLAQKREAEAILCEMEMEKEKPFARTKDDPDLDKMLRNRFRFGDPMAHLVKRKNDDIVLEDLGDNEKMKESGFLIPQTIPSHSWIKRGIDPSANRYGIRPGRHWDGVDRSNGYEKELFKRQNEKRATEREAYLWSVSDM